MLEDTNTRMDKKSHNRSTPSQSRASAVDCKKSSELTNKPLQRYNKKREGSSTAPKNEPSRKNPAPSKGRGQVDKRSRVRGSTGLAMGGMEISGIADDEPELGSVFVPEHRKQNLTHMLFKYGTQRGVSRYDKFPPSRQRRGQKAASPHNQDLYLQASCQFVLKEDADCAVYLADPDIPIKWDHIEEIVVRAMGGGAVCPICLGALAAGRVGRCGHAHCWPCALHHADAHALRPPPCPVCQAPLRVDTLKPARVLQWQPPDKKINMRLVRRIRGSTAVEAAPERGSPAEAPRGVLPLDALHGAPYSKLFVANKQQVHDILVRERKELQDQILAEIDTSEIVYIEQAINLLNVQERNMNQIYQKTSDIPTCSDNLETVPPIVYEQQGVRQKKIDWFDFTEDNLSSSPTEDSMGEELEDLAASVEELTLSPDEEFGDCDDQFLEEQQNSEKLTENDRENQAKYFYFYQAEDGQQVFLHNVNVRMLCATWGALVAAPRTLQARVLHRQADSVDEQVRKHTPCAAHLPLHCPFDIVQVDLRPPYVTKATLDTFADEIQRLAATRASAKRAERRHEREHRRRMEGPPRPDLTSAAHFPPASPRALDLPALPSQSSSSLSPVLQPSPPASGISFAKMASTSGTWRVRVTRAPTPPPPEDEPVEAGAPRALLLSDAFEAFEAARHATSATTTAAAPTNKRRNKKSKQTVLFSTGMPRTA